MDFIYDNENRLVKASGARNANIIVACPELVSGMLMASPMKPTSGGSNIVCPRHAGSMAKRTQIWLAELGLYYYKARVYSPTLGRFLQTDPIGYEDQYNLYAYVSNDPVNNTDPTGNRAIHVTDKQGNETIQFLVAFSGPDSNNTQAKQDVLDSFQNITTPNNETIEVIEVSPSRIGKRGVTEAKLSNSGFQSFCKTDSSCADSIGGDTIYIDTSKADRGPVSAHELGHTGGATDGYEGSTGVGLNRTQPTHHNRPESDIMSSRSGRTLGSKSINEIKNDSRKRDKRNSRLVCKNAPDYAGCS